MTKPIEIKKHHLDRRAADLIQQDAPDDALLTEREVADYLRLSQPWLQSARHYGYGPKFVRLGRQVRYLRRDVNAWLRERAEESAAAFAKRREAQATRAASADPNTVTEDAA